MLKGRFFIAKFITKLIRILMKNSNVKFASFSGVLTVKFAITEISRKWDCPSFLLLKAQKVGQLAGL